jgi:hypothetical protein
MKRKIAFFLLIAFTGLLSFSQTNLAVDGSKALASGEMAGGEVALAFDADTTTGWMISPSSSQWIRYDLETSRAVNGYSMHYLADSAAEFQPVSWTFEGSDNGTDWTVIDNISDNIIFVEWEQFITNNITAYRYYRLNILESGADTLAIGELQLYVIETPSVFTGYANYIEAQLASCSGNVTKTGGTPVLQRGICYNTTGNPTLDHAYRTSSAGVGSYNIDINNLYPNTTYYFRAFATNAKGTSYATTVRSFTTLKLNQTITFPAMESKTYGDADFDPGATVTCGLPVSYSSSNTSVATIVNNRVHIAGGGSTIITASHAGNSSYYPATPVEQVLTVNKKSLQVQADNAEKIYGENSPFFTVSYSGFVSGDNSGVLDNAPGASCDATVLSDVGSYFITPSGGSDNSYSFTYLPGYLYILKAPLELIINDSERIYGDENPSFNWIYYGFVNNDDAAGIDALPDAATDAAAESDAGSYTVTLQGGGDNNYEFDITDGLLTVLKAELSGRPDDQVKNYGASNPLLTCSFEGFKNDDDASSLDTVPLMTTEVDETSEVGNYPIEMHPYQDKNYNISYSEGIFYVEQAFLNALAEDTSRYEGEANPEFTIIYTGFVNDDTPEDIDTPPMANCIADESSAPGNYAIEVSGGSDNNYFFLTYNGILNVMEKPDALSGREGTGMEIYPNPADDILFLRVTDLANLTVRLSDISGNILLTQILQTNSIDIASIAPGVYLLTATKNGRIIYHDKVMIE